MRMLQLYNCLSSRHLNLLSRFGALTGGLESASTPRGSEADSRGSNWTKLDSTVESTWVEPRQIHQVHCRLHVSRAQSIPQVHQNGSPPWSTKSVDSPADWFASSAADSFLVLLRTLCTYSNTHSAATIHM